MKLLGEYIQRGGPEIIRGKKLIFGINRHRAWQIVKECAEKASLPKLVNPETGRMHNVSPHRFRDAFAVMAVKRDDTGDELRMLQEHLGHASFKTPQPDIGRSLARNIAGGMMALWISGNSDQSE